MAVISVEDALQTLLSGQICAIPTETVYGLAANAGDSQAVRAVFAAKDRPVNHPLIVHLATAATAETDGQSAWAERMGAFAHDIPACAEKLAARFWPGPLTLILPRKPDAAEAAAAGQPTIALRCPNHPVTQQLLSACLEKGIHGLAAPSANPFGKLSPTTSEHVIAYFGDEIDVLEGGACEKGIESTIVLCEKQRVTVLRPGSISLSMLQSAVPEAKVSAGGNAPSENSTPGSLSSHYQPRTQIRLMPRKSLQDAIHIIGKAAKNIGIYTRTPMDRLSPAMPRVAMSNDPTTAAQNLYADLHSIDDMNLKLVWVETPPDTEEWAAVRDRLEKAAAG